MSFCLTWLMIIRQIIGQDNLSSHQGALSYWACGVKQVYN